MLHRLWFLTRTLKSKHWEISRIRYAGFLKSAATYRDRTRDYRQRR